MENQQELPYFTEQENVLILEVDIHMGFLRPPECHQEVGYKNAK